MYHRIPVYHLLTSLGFSPSSDPPRSDNPSQIFIFYRALCLQPILVSSTLLIKVPTCLHKNSLWLFHKNETSLMKYITWLTNTLRGPEKQVCMQYGHGKPLMLQVCYSWNTTAACLLIDMYDRDRILGTLLWLLHKKQKPLPLWIADLSLSHMWLLCHSVTALSPGWCIWMIQLRSHLAP